MARIPLASSIFGRSISLGVALYVAFLSNLVQAQQQGCITATDTAGPQECLDPDRRPALYTQDFGDCFGDSLIDVTMFNGAYYIDNSTVTWNLVGTTPLRNESIMIYLDVYAYGETRFEMVIDPCNINMFSLCPMNSGQPIQANGFITVSQLQTGNIPSIAYSIPDFEGQAIIRVFSNSTQSQIACYSAVLTNGASFAHQEIIGSILGVFTVIAIITSLAVAVYGTEVESIRAHYAHSLSVMVVFAVFHHIFFTGALSMNWPSVLVAFWSNYAWAAGMINIEQMQNTINDFLGSSKGNISTVGAAPVGVNDNGLAGGYDITSIYKRSYSWAGSAAPPGLPLPGNYSGFAGTLAVENIPASNAFLTGLIWFVVVLGGVMVIMMKFKVTIEFVALLGKLGARWSFYRKKWLSYTVSAALRTFLIGFYMITFLALFQFTLGGSTPVKVVAGVVFAVFVLGMLTTAAFTIYIRLRRAKAVFESDKLVLQSRTLLFRIPWVRLRRESHLREEEKRMRVLFTFPWCKLHYADQSGQQLVHDDVRFLAMFGWLYARFRTSRWWFFSLWLIYELARACFFGGAAGHPMTQVFGILAVEFIALVSFIWMRPFEGTRLNALMVYLLGFSKVSTVALSSAFDPTFNLDRLTTTVIGIVIIVIQGVLTIFLLIAIVLGAITTYMSLSRYNGEDTFRPRSWRKRRGRYLTHVDEATRDLPRPSRAPKVPEPSRQPSFNVRSVQRVPKIEDEDEDNIVPFPDIEEATEATEGPSDEVRPVTPSRVAPRRTSSLKSNVSFSNLPYGARPVRPSWSSRDFTEWQEGQSSNSVWAGSSSASPGASDNPPRPSSRNVNASRRNSTRSLREQVLHQRANSRGSPFPMARCDSPASITVPDTESIAPWPVGALARANTTGHALQDVSEELTKELSRQG